MTRVYLEQDGNWYMLSCRGHATGSVEACAAVSCLVYTLAGWLHNTEDACAEAETIEDGYVVLRFTGGEAARIAFELVLVGFLQLAQEYGEYVSVESQVI